jgi:hypothetical protein
MKSPYSKSAKKTILFSGRCGSKSLLVLSSGLLLSCQQYFSRITYTQPGGRHAARRSSTFVLLSVSINSIPRHSLFAVHWLPWSKVWFSTAIVSIYSTIEASYSKIWNRPKGFPKACLHASQDELCKYYATDNRWMQFGIGSDLFNSIYYNRNRINLV